MRKKKLSLAFIFFGALFFCTETVADIVINEIMYRQTVNGINTDEFIELYNNGSSAVDIGGWFITDRENNGLNFTIPAGTNLGVNQYVVIWLGAVTPTNDAPLAQYQFWISDRHRLNNRGDDVLLRDSSGNNIDYVSYGSSNALDPVPSDLTWNNSLNGALVMATKGRSISLVPNGVDSDTSACWELTANASNPNVAQCTGYIISIDASSVFNASPGRSNNLESDIAVTKSDEFATYTPGQTASYEIVITNSGPDNVTGLSLEDVLPNGVSLNGSVSCVPVVACALPVTVSPDGQTLSTTIDIANGEAVTVTIPVIYSTDPMDY